MGTFTMYYQAPRMTTAHELKLAPVIAQTAGLLVAQHEELQGRDQVERMLREGEAYWQRTAFPHARQAEEHFMSKMAVEYARFPDRAC